MTQIPESGTLKIMLAAGGTGGHMTPAHALATELKDRGHDIGLITDARGLRFPDLFTDVDTFEIPASNVSAAGVIGKLRGAITLLRGIRAARAILREAKPDLVMGFGGYPSLPAMMAARLMGIPYAMHEQNAVVGRVNRLFARQAAAIALSYGETKRLTPVASRHAYLTGNPVRTEITDAGGTAFTAPTTDGPLRLLIVGGSQGARILSDVVPKALCRLPSALRKRLHVVQQCRPEDMERVKRIYHGSDIGIELATYLTDMPAQLTRAHLVIARSGASTVSEILTIGRPAIYVPLEIATDDHQAANVREVADLGAGWMLREDRFSPDTLARFIAEIVAHQGVLAMAAGAALRMAQPQAASLLADMIEKVCVTRSAGTGASLQTAGGEAQS